MCKTTKEMYGFVKSVLPTAGENTHTTLALLEDNFQTGRGAAQQSVGRGPHERDGGEHDEDGDHQGAQGVGHEPA